jgi:hypothetical protein
MKCPHCKKEISNDVLNKHFASRGGKTSKRKITPEQQAKMQTARRKPNDSVNLAGIDLN